MAKERGDGQYYIRGTFTKYNKDFSNDVLHFYEKGFEQISIEPVVTDPKLPYALTEEDLPEVYAEYEKLAKIIIEKRKNGEFFNFFHFMIDLDPGSMRHQTSARLRLWKRVCFGYTGGRCLPMSSVCRQTGMDYGQRQRSVVEHRDQRFLCKDHRLHQTRVPHLLGKILLQRRMQCK